MSHLDAMARTLVTINVEYLAAHEDAPKLADAGVVLSSVIADVWSDIPSCIAARRASSLDLACWKAAEMIRSGEKAAIVFGSYDTVFVGTEDGKLIAAETLAPRLPLARK
jgi:hypothetical protein